MTVLCGRNTSQFYATNDFRNWFTGHFRGSRIPNLLCGQTMVGSRAS